MGSFRQQHYNHSTPQWVIVLYFDLVKSLRLFQSSQRNSSKRASFWRTSWHRSLQTCRTSL